MSNRNTQMRISLTLYKAALAQTQQVGCNLTPREVIENCLKQGQDLLAVLKCCQSELGREEYPMLRTMIDETIRRCNE